MENSETILEVQNLRKNFQGFSLKSISFTLPRGYIMGFIGPNGAGKSTTIKLIMNLIKRNDGAIKVFGLDNIENEKQVKDSIGFVYDENHYFEEWTIRNMAKMVAACYSKWDQKTFEHYLKEFELNPKQKIKELSKGMKLKFSLAVALSHQAELLIMDEPTSGLDPVIRSELLEILSSLIQDEQKSIFFSTHITSDLDKIADFITFINDGEIVLSAPKDDVLEQYAIVKGGKELSVKDSGNLFVGYRTTSFGFEGLVRDGNQARNKFKESIIIERPTLEDLMLYTARGEQHV